VSRHRLLLVGDDGTIASSAILKTSDSKPWMSRCETVDNVGVSLPGPVAAIIDHSGGPQESRDGRAPSPYWLGANSAVAPPHLEEPTSMVGSLSGVGRPQI